MADNFDEFDDDRDEVEAAEEDALYLAEEVNIPGMSSKIECT